MDMRFYWLQDRARQKQFDITWEPGQKNKADYYTKHHPPAHHQAMRPVYLVNAIRQERDRILRGCANLGLRG